MDGLECNEIGLHYVMDKSLRADAEYYQKDNLFLESILKSVEGKTISAHAGTTDCSAFYPSITGYYSDNRNDIPFLRVNEIVDGLVVISDKTVFLPKRVLEDNRKTIALAYPGDIIIAKGGNTLAKVGLVTDEYNVYATCRDVIILRTGNMKNLNKFYLWAYLHGTFGQKLMWRSASQTGQPHLTLKAIDGIHVPEYSITLQKAIERLYNKSVCLKQKSQKKYNDANEVLKKVLNMPKGDTQAISVKKLSESFKKVCRLDAEYYQPKYDQLFSALATFKTSPLGGCDGVADFQKSIEPGSESYGEKGIPFVRVSDITKFGVSAPEIKLPVDIVEHPESLFPKKDSILFSKDGSVGIAYKLEEDAQFITSSALLQLTVRDTEKVLPDYLTLVLNSPVVQLQAERASNGAVIQHWKPSEIQQVIIPILDMSEQKKLSQIIQESFSLRRRSEQLLNCAKQAVELAIEQGEDVAIEWLKEKGGNG